MQDPSSGDIYYYSAGDGTDASGAIFKFTFTQGDLALDGEYATAAGNAAIAYDGNNIVLLTQPRAGLDTGIATYDLSQGEIDRAIPLTNGSPLAIDAEDGGGLICAAIPVSTATNTTDAVDCDNGSVFTLPGIPQGSGPAAVKVVDASHVVVYGRGDNTQRWYTISGTTATAAGTLPLQGFANYDANFWNFYVGTGGWYLVQVGSTLAAMGQVVNADQSVSQKLALINNNNQSVLQYVNLPDGTIRIAPDPVNNAILAEYPDFSVSPPLTRFFRVYVDTGNTATLGATSNLVPGAGFIVTQDGRKIAIFVDGKYDFEPNQ